ncbi:MAG: hypothetical protein IPJ41_17035 [Phycisphaerales bacterium]|nr:hypothetical protein [Phycisphaerales bacterium]
MRCLYSVYFECSRTHTKLALKALVARFDGLSLDPVTQAVYAHAEQPARTLFEAARALGYKCSFNVSPEYEIEDSLAGELGLLSADSRDRGGRLPPDAFDFSTACVGCGLGAAQVKPIVLSAKSIQYRGSFNHGIDGAHRFIMRADIGHAIVEATGQPWCMRHPVTRSGEVVEDWLEPVPCATMPPLSRKSLGVQFGTSTSGTSLGEDPEVIEPCPVCGRSMWEYDMQYAPRLMYPRAAIEAAQQHAVVAMYEPFGMFPGFDLRRRTFSDLGGLPWLLFNHKAVEVLVRFMGEYGKGRGAFIEPVFSE